MARRKPRLHLIDHPLLHQRLTEARDRGTPAPRFRQLMSNIGELLAYEVARDLPTREYNVATPLEPYRGKRLAPGITIVPILRAGLGLVEGILRLMPEAAVGHIGMFRNEESLAPVSYYDKLPTNINAGPALLVDPMLATGGSALSAVALLRNRGCRDIRMVCVVASPEGVARLSKEHPDVPIYAAALDRELDDRGYILPGLGDAGDRMFGTHE